MKARLAVAALALAGVASLSAASADAAAPQQTVVPINDTFTVTDICPFPIAEHAEGTLRIIDFVDRNGNPTRELFISPGLTVSFSANGVTLTTVSPSVGHITFNDDSATVMIAGLSGHISIPGQGTVALSAGRILAVITDDEPQIVAMNGTFSFGFGDLPPIEAQLCDALA
ncbi:MAG TPA: hypothetical protein VKB09_06600 [Thermomicrobiales bacterium]|jgi:hypothetical protein|nr:hypothetical protein [Thermomicrobiales bacterium]